MDKQSRFSYSSEKVKPDSTSMKITEPSLLSQTVRGNPLITCLNLNSKSKDFCIPSPPLQSEYSDSQQQRTNQEIDACPVHRLPLIFYCLNEGKKICEHCVLYGDHCRHNYKRLEDLSVDYRMLKEKKKGFYKVLDNLKSTKESNRMEFERRLGMKKKQVYQKIELAYNEVISRAKERLETYKNKTELMFQQIESHHPYDLLDFKVAENCIYQALKELANQNRRSGELRLFLGKSHFKSPGELKEIYAGQGDARHVLQDAILT